MGKYLSKKFLLSHKESLEKKTNFFRDKILNNILRLLGLDSSRMFRLDLIGQSLYSLCFDGDCEFIECVKRYFLGLLKSRSSCTLFKKIVYITHV